MDSTTTDERPAKRLKTSPEPALEYAAPKTEATSAAAGSALNQHDAVAEKEIKVGISAFVSAERPVLRGVLKQRYTDFQVNEISPDGKVYHLRSLKAPRPAGTLTDKPKPNHTSDGINEPLNQHSPDQVPDLTTVSDDDKALLISHLNEQAVTELLVLRDAIVADPKKKPKDLPQVRTTFTSDRMIRTQIHQDIRRIFSSRIDSSTDKDGVLVLRAANRGGGPQQQQNRSKGRGRLDWAERGGEYCHFTLYKENKDSGEVLSFMARMMKTGSRTFSVAGTKDRRAATVQRACAYRVEAERLSQLNKTLRGAAVGDFEYHKTDFELGDLAGNEFVVTLRDCQLDTTGEASSLHDLGQAREQLRQAMAKLHTNGFLNYYGLQRFGTFAIATDAIGQKILKEDFEAACNLLLEYNTSALELVDPINAKVGWEDRARAEAIKLWREDPTESREAVEKMPKRFIAEVALIRHLGRNPNDFFGALMMIPRNLKIMYTHAYQSLVWNKAATERWRLYGSQVVEGDLVLVKDHGDGMKGEPVADKVDADGEIVIQPEGEDMATSADQVFERARPLSAAEASSGRFSVFDIVMPSPGYDVVYPANASGEFYKHFMGNDEGGKLDPYNMRRKQKDFSMSGHYRKLLSNIGKDWDVDVRQYVKPDEQFVKTDLEKIQAATKPATSAKSQDVAAGNDDGLSVEVPEAQEENGQEEKIAVILKFQLDAGQYATMALRELSLGGIREYKPDFSGGR